MQKNWLKKVFIGISAFGVLAFASVAMADDIQPPCGNDVNDPLALDCVKGSKLSNSDPRLIATRVINIVLGVLGTIATILIFYAGFLWMTAAGNEENVTKAKSIMSAAVIGLVIILAAFSISTFFIKNVYKAVNNTDYTGG